MQIWDTENKWKEMCLTVYDNMEEIIAPDDSPIENGDNRIMWDMCGVEVSLCSITTSLGATFTANVKPLQLHGEIGK